MPNWCFGCLKARGTKENLINFLDNGISMMKFSATENSNVVINENFYKLEDQDDDYYEIIWQVSDHGWLYIKDTNRAFVDDGCYWHPSRLMKFYDNCWMLYFPINQAWNYRTEDWEELSEKYNINFRFYGIESGIGFTRDVEIINGHAERDLTSRYQLNNANYYDDFIWECPFPELGG